MPLTIIDGPHFKAGDAISDAVDCTSGRIVRITMPAGWTPALLSCQISTDGEFFNDLVDMQGKAVAINVHPGAAVLVPDMLGRAAEFLRFRSGTPDNPVPQEEDRNFAVAIETVAPVVIMTEAKHGSAE